MTNSVQAPTVEQRPARPYVAVPAHVTSEAEFRRAADEGFPRLFGWLGERGLAPAGPPFIRYAAGQRPVPPSTSLSPRITS